MTSVEDVLADRPPSLRLRAQEALTQRLLSKAAADAQGWEELEFLAREFMNDVLALNPGDINDLEFEHGRKSSDELKVIFRVDGLRFQVSYSKRRLMRVQSEQFFDPEIIYEYIPTYEVYSNTGFVKVTCLADIGAAL